MNWNEIGTQVIISLAGVLISGLGLMMTYLINKFIKDEKLKNLATSLSQLVQNAVLDTYQTYVQYLKEHGDFDKEAQEEALKRCLELINKNMPNDMKEWLEVNYKDVQGYLKTLVEAQIGLLKNRAK